MSEILDSYELMAVARGEVEVDEAGLHSIIGAFVMQPLADTLYPFVPRRSAQFLHRALESSTGDEFDITTRVHLRDWAQARPKEALEFSASFSQLFWQSREWPGVAPTTKSPGLHIARCVLWLAGSNEKNMRNSKTVVTRALEDCPVELAKDRRDHLYRIVGQFAISDAAPTDSFRARIDPLNAEQEIGLFQTIELWRQLKQQQADGLKVPTDEEMKEKEFGALDAKAAIILANQGLIWFVAKRHTWYWQFLSAKEVVFAGNEGLSRAVDKFELAKQRKFSTYSAYWIRAFISQAAYRAAGEVLNIPTAMVPRVWRIGRVRNGLYEQLGREPTIKEIADRTNKPSRDRGKPDIFSLRTIENLVGYATRRHVEPPQDLADPSGDQAFELSNDLMALKQATRGILEPIELLVVQLRCGYLGRVYTIKDIAAYLGESESTAATIWQRSKHKLRNNAELFKQALREVY